jgi:putative hydrolase of the HAD superfamily
MTVTSTRGRRIKKIAPGIKVIIFDLDGTLYTSEVIRQKFAEAAYLTLAKFKRIPLTTAQKMIEDRRAELKKKEGYSVPYTLTLLSYGVPIESWHEENIKFFDPRDFLVKDEKFRATLARLRGRYRLVVLTNNNSTQAERILKALDIDGLFEKVFTYNSFRLLKPEVEFFKKAAAELAADPDECLVVGDRYNIDLNPAKGLGMQTYEVKGPADIHDLARRL